MSGGGPRWVELRGVWLRERELAVGSSLGSDSSPERRITRGRESGGVTRMTIDSTLQHLDSMCARTEFLTSIAARSEMGGVDS